MIGIILVLSILIICGIIIYYVYKNGYIPYTNPHLEKSKLKIDNIINEIEVKSTSPDNELAKDKIFLDKKFKEMSNLIQWNSKIKDYIISIHSNNLSKFMGILLNHHLADADMSYICENDTDTKFKGYYNFMKDTFKQNIYFSKTSELFDVCYLITSKKLNEDDKKCYEGFISNSPGFNICSIDKHNELIK